MTSPPSSVAPPQVVLAHGDGDGRPPLRDCLHHDSWRYALINGKRHNLHQVVCETTRTTVLECETVNASRYLTDATAFAQRAHNALCARKRKRAAVVTPAVVTPAVAAAAVAVASNGPGGEVAPELGEPKRAGDATDRRHDDAAAMQAPDPSRGRLHTFTRLAPDTEKRARIAPPATAAAAAAAESLDVNNKSTPDTAGGNAPAPPASSGATMARRRKKTAGLLLAAAFSAAAAAAATAASRQKLRGGRERFRGKLVVTRTVQQHLPAPFYADVRRRSALRFTETSHVLGALACAGAADPKKSVADMGGGGGGGTKTKRAATPATAAAAGGTTKKGRGKSKPAAAATAAAAKRKKPKKSSSSVTTGADDEKDVAAATTAAADDTAETRSTGRGGGGPISNMSSLRLLELSVAERLPIPRTAVSVAYGEQERADDDDDDSRSGENFWNDGGGGCSSSSSSTASGRSAFTFVGAPSLVARLNVHYYAHLPRVGAPNVAPRYNTKPGVAVEAIQAQIRRDTAAFSSAASSASLDTFVPSTGRRPAAAVETKPQEGGGSGSGGGGDDPSANDTKKKATSKWAPVAAVSKLEFGRVFRDADGNRSQLVSLQGQLLPLKTYAVKKAVWDRLADDVLYHTLNSTNADPGKIPPPPPPTATATTTTTTTMAMAVPPQDARNGNPFVRIALLHDPETGLDPRDMTFRSPRRKAWRSAGAAWLPVTVLGGGTHLKMTRIVPVADTRPPETFIDAPQRVRLARAIKDDDDDDEEQSGGGGSGDERGTSGRRDADDETVYAMVADDSCYLVVAAPSRTDDTQRSPPAER